MIAEDLFKTCLAKMQDSVYETDCSCFAESQRIVPKPGTLFTLATCEAQAGRVATSATYYEAYLTWFAKMSPAEQAAQRNMGRETFATDKLKELAAVTPRLVITLAAGAPKETIVSLDGRVLPPTSLGVDVPVDPGPHVVTTKTPGKPPSETRVSVEKGEKKEVRLKVDAASPSGPQPPNPTATPGDGATDATSRVWRTYIPVGVGSVGLLVGAFFLGAHTVSEDSDATTPGMMVGFGMTAAGGLLLLILTAADSPAPAAKARATSIRPQVTFGPTGATLGAQAVW
jgi:hypothetical protein